MPLLYNCCSLFLYPSLRESFGMPVLEAMACGKPVIASSIPALREVAGDAAIFVDPDDASKIGEEISTLLSDQGKRAIQIQKGLQRTKMFSWERSAIKLMNLYKTI
jgi:glycosyltransferase involved in cell wall biosynthesis